MTREELLAEAMKEWKAGNRLSKNLTMHRERYMMRNKDKLNNVKTKPVNKIPKGESLDMTKEQLDKVKTKPVNKIPEGNLEEVPDRFKRKLSKGGVTKSRTGPQDFRKGGMVLSTVDNRKNK